VLESNSLNSSLTPFVVKPRYPGPTLRALELIPQEAFRRDIISPEAVARMMQEGIEAASNQMG
jgi:mediator of RNA polymerase II transcription subunit 31